MGKQAFILIGLFLLVAPVAAEQPNMEPGLWRYVTTTVMEGEPMGRQEQERTHQQCVTAADLQDPEFMMEGVEDCEISNRSVSASAMNYEMRCEQQSGMVINMTADIRFLGERMEGTMIGTMASSMGEMNMDVSMEAERIGDCEDGDAGSREGDA